ncbi:hypothetical protein ES706_03512 [subsurface metagenome]
MDEMRLANEKSLELNLTHQLLMRYRSAFVVGTTLRAESTIGADSIIQTPYRAVFYQYKASNPRKSVDGQRAYFRINNNYPRNDQHIRLHRLARAFGSGSFFYAFPLVVTDNYFQTNASNLVPMTIFVDVYNMPQFRVGDSHRVQVDSNGAYQIFSEVFRRGESIVGEAFIESLKDKKIGYEVSTEEISDFFGRLVGICRDMEMGWRILKIAFFHPENPFIYSLRLG